MSELKIKNGDGTYKYLGVIGTGATGNPYYNIPADIQLEIPKGNVVGHSSVNKFGANDTIPVATREDINDVGGTYSYPATALITSMSQTADQVAMRGATIEWQGLDASWDAVTQTAILDASNTTTVVTLTTPMIRVFRGKVMADVVSDQDIRCHNAGETVDYAVITAGNNQTLMAQYTVPNGKTAYMKKYFVDAIPSTGKEPDSVEFKLWAADRYNSYEFQLKHARATSKATSSITNEFAPYSKYTQKTDIKITALPSGDPAAVQAGFDLILVDN